MLEFREIERKPLVTLSPLEVAWLHLNSHTTPRTKDFRIHSSLREMEDTMRHTNHNTRTEIFGPLLCAFAIWDQIGSTYINKRRPPYAGANTSIKKALHHFGDASLTPTQIHNLYMLRNGIVHDASFTSYEKIKINDSTHKKWYMFRLKNDLRDVIQPAEETWDGSADNISPGITTAFNRQKLIDMTFDATELARAMLRNNSEDLEIIADKSDIIHKYLLWLPIKKA